MMASGYKAWLAVLLGCVALGVGPLCAGQEEEQEESFTLEDVFGEFDPHVLTNLDASAVSEATGLDASQVDQIRRNLQEMLQGDYVIEVEPLRQLALAALPLIGDEAKWQPYAAWIRAWIESTEGVEELEITIPAPVLSLPTPLPPPAKPDAGRLTLAPAIIPPEPVMTTQPTRQWPARARPYVSRLKPIFAAEGVPPELVWIADVESRFNPNAHSRVGAAGLFQIMPETAFLLGLRTKPRDERLDPEKSAQACAEYLKYLYGKFGNWPLVVAAYNGGEGRVRRLLAETGTKRFEAIAARLPEETRNYVPKVEATLVMHEGKSLVDLGPVW